jgi:hypothetical protein
MKLLIFTAFLLLFIFCKNGNAFSQNLSEEQKIERLIQFVADLKGAKFIRNGEAHDAKKAAEHLAMKRKNAGGKIKTALDFIEKVASKSSLSGETYKIKFADGVVKNSADVLKTELKRIEGKN